ncbi:MAG: signal peptidase I [Flavobacteriales bacterium]|nr:signal peptidase I [Flavobacteriales bacterium]MCC6938115.1 signal peptidase I [Flavobacteriales bacterium]
MDTPSNEQPRFKPGAGSSARKTAFLRNEWFRAFLLALVVLVALHAFVFRFVSVQSTSMYATLKPGDLLLVLRWSAWAGLDRGDVVVFRDPLKDRDPMRKRPLLVKRVAAGPGDVLQVKRGHLVVNGEVQAPQPGITMSYLIRVKDSGEVVADEILRSLQLPKELAIRDRGNIEVPLNAVLAKEVEKDPMVISADPMRLATGSRRHLFPFSPRYAWNGDDYGPISVPRKGDTLHINVDNFPLYDRLMSVYEGHTLGVNGNTMLLDGSPLTNYVVEQDYYFVLGDCRHYSADSRYWGFLPADHVVGRGVLIHSGNGVD